MLINILNVTYGQCIRPDIQSLLNTTCYLKKTCNITLNVNVNAPNQCTNDTDNKIFVQYECLSECLFNICINTRKECLKFKIKIETISNTIT